MLHVQHSQYVLSVRLPSDAVYSRVLRLTCGQCNEEAIEVMRVFYWTRNIRSACKMPFGCYIRACSVLTGTGHNVTLQHTLTYCVRCQREDEKQTALVSTETFPEETDNQARSGKDIGDKGAQNCTWINMETVFVERTHSFATIH
jgi:hypothetical protein